MVNLNVSSLGNAFLYPFKEAFELGKALVGPIEFNKKNMSKALALAAFPNLTLLYGKYSVVKYAASVVAAQNTIYSIKKDGTNKYYKTPDSFAQFFESKKNGEWDLSEYTFNANSVLASERLLKHIFETTKDPEVFQLQVAQVITKLFFSWCSDFISKGLEVDLPVINSEGQKEMVKYTVDEKFNLWENVPAIGLVDKENKHPPLLLFRSTNDEIKHNDGLASMVANLHPKGAGWKLFTNSQDDVTSWLKKAVTESNQKARAYGYSQGGTVAGYFLTYYSELFSDNDKTPSFILDAPALPSSTGDAFRGLDNKPACLTYVTHGDIVPKYGSDFLGKAYAITLTDNLSTKEHHKVLASFAKEWRCQEIDLEKERKSSIRSAFYIFQKTIGHALYNPLKKAIKPIQVKWN